MNTNLTQCAEGESLPESDLVYDFDQISAALDQLAARLNKTMAGTNPIVLCVMNGALIFSGHLLTRISFQCELDYIHATRYRNTTQGDALKWLSYPKSSLRGRTVLILDDILDEGITMEAIEKYCYSEGAKRVEKAVLLHKHHDRCCAEINSEHVALKVEDQYVFGFGMDYEGKFRHLNAIYSLRG
jgi:hypoxanthine phosphoribosyltransferase